MIQMIFGCKSGKRAEYTLAVGVGAASRPRLAFNCKRTLVTAQWGSVARRAQPWGILIPATSRRWVPYVECLRNGTAL